MGKRDHIVEHTYGSKISAVVRGGAAGDAHREIPSVEGLDADMCMVYTMAIIKAAKFLSQTGFEPMTFRV